jgi:hypothetical protein
MADPMPTELPPALVAQVRASLQDLRLARLSATAWPAVAGDVARLAAAVDHADPAAVEQALVPVSRTAYEGKVRRRLAGAGGRAAVVTATKQTSALPIVGAVCGVLICGLGYLIGGGLVLVATAVFGLFIFGVAVAGTRTNAERTEDRLARRASPTREALQPPPLAVVEAIGRLEAELSG